MYFAAAPLAIGVFAGLANAKAQGYNATQGPVNWDLQTAFDASNFFDSFDFFTGTDPTAGFVDYVDANTANSEKLAGVSNGTVFMGVDSTTKNTPNGRKSVRVTSKQAFTHGLFIADFAHMPGSICGTWPAFWMFGPDWPGSGEIDIIEGVNAQTSNQVTLHSAPGCAVTNDGTAEGTSLSGTDCGAGGGGPGCGQTTSDNQNYGDGFNAIGGGIYATEWVSDHISVWFFPRSSLPVDITSGVPNPSSWGKPLARFNGDLDPFFKNNNLVFDTTFCGQWAGQVWATDAECSALASSCEAYVSDSPEAFTESYWSVNAITVYQIAA